MLGTDRSPVMTPHQVELVEHALRQVLRIARPSWDEIPLHLHSAFAKYMRRDLWTGAIDLVSLPEAAFTIVRDAVTRTGEFAVEL